MIIGIATGVGSGLGAGVAERLSRVARERLGADEESRQVLERFDGDPAVPAAQDDLRARLLATIEQDPEFAARLRTAGGLPPGPPGSINQNVNIGRDMKNGVIAIGPVSIRKTPGTMAALFIVVVLVLGFAVNGVVRFVDSDNSPATGIPWDAGLGPGSDGDGSGGAGPAAGGGVRNKAAAVRDVALAKAIAPDLQSMPSGWGMETEPVFSDCTSECQGRLHTGGVGLADSSGDTQVAFNYRTYDTVENAKAAYQEYAEKAGGTVNGSRTTMSLAQVGDSSVAYSSRRYTGSAYLYKGFVYLRVGTVYGQVEYNTGYKDLDTEKLTAFARLLVDRAQQAQNGQMPSAQAAL
ncbi:hypothetical protein [Streptomyces sp. TBY4]|uniref:hypothetical protein n=1 Tax=Streptomyces sp. TBY4 TaxID=2962030 RepID=UPI0020B74661|nr:hypothetical protein [Streptomyces sp. TBY4]MCP3755202.1 hypothetical protein [Streptomyces sp. TBY4]